MAFSSDGLWSGLGTLALWLGVPAIIIAIVVWLLRRRGSTAIAVKTVRVLSGAFLGLSLIGVVSATVALISRPDVYLSGPLRTWVAQNGNLLVSPACSEGIYPGDTGASGAFLCGDAVKDVPFGPRFVIYLGALLGGVAAAAIAWAIQVAAYQAEIGDVFNRSVPRTFTCTAIIAMASAVPAAVLTSVGMTLSARSLQWDAEASPPFFFEIPVWSFLVALGMFALAAIFHHGARLQQETAGLV